MSLGPPESSMETKVRPDLLIVDDDPLISDTLSFVLGRDFNVYAADSRGQVQSLLTQLGEPPGLALVDLGLPPTPHRPDEGFKLIGDLLGAAPQMKILVLSGQNDEANARHARALGAVDFVAKPCEPERLKELLLRASGFSAAEKRDPAATSGIVGRSFPIERLREQITLYGSSPFPVLIEGESGSGKELVAEALHRAGLRAGRPYLALNCAAISANLVEPTLFGHAKGAFTGAAGARSGYFEDARDGTLFLDEIGELPLELQAKLLRVLENGEFQRVGETQSRHSEARVIAATNRGLREEVRAGRFRLDLYHRLSVFAIQVAPLRELGQDRQLLLEHFTALYAAQTGAPPFVLSPEALALWMDYPFPGNVRELRNVVIRLITRHSGQKVSREQLATELDFAGSLQAHEETATPAPSFEPSVQAARGILETRHNLDLDETLRQWERCFVEAALAMSHGNFSQAARMLGVRRTTLYGRVQGHDTHTAGGSPGGRA
ncbi:MAG: sigma-54-dependent transcriptional regulator [Betaproteobacteria bacterium]